MALINARIKRFFFDRALVKNTVRADILRFLRHAGGFARKVARAGQKRVGKARKPPKNMNGRAFEKWQREVTEQPASTPPNPPNVHSDDAVRTLKNIIFAYDTNTSVIVGVQLLRTVKQINSNETPVPGLMERGGQKEVVEKLVSGGRKWVPLRGRARPGQPTRKRMAKYPKRPIMEPARKATIKKFGQLWFSEVH
jgi:hypothetical protein